MIAWLTAGVALGHGGPPNSQSLMWTDAGTMTIETSHGFLFEANGWSWVCEELFGETALVTKTIQVDERVVTATTEGIAWSDDGCSWTWSESISDAVVWELAIDLDHEQRIWALTNDGLWFSDNGSESFSYAGSPDPDASCRSFLHLPDGQQLIMGFLNGEATAWLGSEYRWSAIPLPIQGGNLHALDVDANGNMYGRFPMANGTDQLLRISPDGSVNTILTTGQSIAAFAVIGDALLASREGHDTVISFDSGETWEPWDDGVFDCIIERYGDIWACPIEDNAALWLRSSDSLSDGGRTWVNGPSFSEVSGPHCNPQIPECEAIWPQVYDELGLANTEPVEPNAPVTSTAEESACTSVNHAHLLWFPAMMMWHTRRRD